MRLINADALINAVEGNPYITDSIKSYVRVSVSEQPTIEERKKGMWLIKAVNTFELAYGSTGYEPVYECSICGGVEESYLRLDEPIMPDDADFPNFCPNCGADMRGEEDERA